MTHQTLSDETEGREKACKRTDGFGLDRNEPVTVLSGPHARPAEA
jgi:hypothetical protein